MGQLDLQVADLADVLVGLGDGLGHEALGQFAGEPLDHEDGVLAAGDDQVQIALFQVVVRGKDDELAVDVGQSHRAQRSLEGQRRDRQRGRGPVHGQDVAVVLLVGGQHEALDLDFVEEPLGPLRPDGPVHEPGGENLLGGRAAFALEESAGEFARRGHALAIIARQREEIAAHSRRAGGRGHQHHGFAILD